MTSRELLPFTSWELATIAIAIKQWSIKHTMTGTAYEQATALAQRIERADSFTGTNAKYLEAKRQHEARKAHGEAIQARREANTPWDKPRYCAPSLRLYDERRQLKYGDNSD